MKNKKISIGVSFLSLCLIYYIYRFRPLLFSKLFNLWPIFMLISGVVLEYLYFDIEKNFLLICSGAMVMTGTMYTINFYINFINTHTIFAILFLALATALLNYYIFTKCTDLVLPFIFLFIIISIIIFLYPIYNNILSDLNTNLVYPYLDY